MARNIIDAKEFARVQAIAALIRSQQNDVLEKVYEKAKEDGDEEAAAIAARAYRNKLLDECDNMMVSDRPNVDLEAWMTYRQALRDIPEQEGFPFEVEFPVKP